MTEGQFELFDIFCGDFVRNLKFFHSQNQDAYTREMLEDMITNIQRYRRVIAETVDTETV